MSENPGKRFERKFRQAVEKRCYVHRINDSFYARTPADFFVFDGNDAFMVECKATQERSLKFAKVQPHQVKALRDFECIGKHTHGFLAVEFYDGESYRGEKHAYLLPIEKWLQFGTETMRSSMPQQYFIDNGVQMDYLHGAYVFAGRWFK